ncbi:MAG: Hsp20/alpha crystallin family protein [Candidatus Brocadiia bacterium]
MADIMRRPTSLSRYFSRPFQRLFEDFFEDLENESGLTEYRPGRRFVPAIDVTEDEDAVRLTAEVPGMEKDDLDVSIDNNVLTLRGEKKEEEVSEDTGYHRVERRYGQFERRIRLPNYVDTEKIDATYDNGVLKLTLPKAETAKAKSIEIQ